MSNLKDRIAKVYELDEEVANCSKNSSSNIILAMADQRALIPEMVEIIRELEKEREWQPIETAPREDIEIFTWSEEWGIVISNYEDKDWRRGWNHRNGHNSATHWLPMIPKPARNLKHIKL